MEATAPSFGIGSILDTANIVHPRELTVTIQVLLHCVCLLRKPTQYLVIQFPQLEIDRSGMRSAL